jgi:transcription antitermination factor NusG
VSTRSRHEQVAIDQLLTKGFEAFVPTVPRWSQWKDRRKKVDWPLFPGYCFVRFDGRDTLPILKCSGVVRIVSFNREPAPVADAEVDGLRRLMDNSLTYDAHPLIREGALVEVTAGPLAGVTGRLLRHDAKHATVLLAVELIGQAVRVQVDADDVSVLEER